MSRATRRFTVGLISGTSMDGVDAVLLELEDGRPRLHTHHAAPYPDALRRRLEHFVALNEAAGIEEFGRLDRALGDVFADAVLTLMDKTGMSASQIRVIGSHGQTVRHAPDGPHPYTLQIGDPNVIAERTGITCVADLRRRDMAAGGQGAPMVPAFHQAVFSAGDETRVVLNLGGIANITVLPADGAPPWAFDTGPASTLMDGWMQRHRGQVYDADGAWAAGAAPDAELLTVLLDEDYFRRPAPKSTGRELFNLAWLERALKRDGRSLSPQIVQSTLCELTAVSVSQAVAGCGLEVAAVLVCGGGAHNGELMARLARHNPGSRLETTATYGVSPDWVEAAAFAWLADRTLDGLPGNLPSATGARHPVVLGAVYHR